ncbi:rab-GTPase-TBC domain-containing protein [Phycomyces blakesleeanus]
MSPGDSSFLDVSQKSFWRRHGLKLPGSVSIVPSNSTGDAKRVIGARYTFNSLVTSTQPPSDKNTILTYSPSLTSPPTPSQQPHRPPVKKNTSASSSSSTSTSPTDPGRHQRSISSPHKSFDAFLMDTNDEWSDTLEASPRPKQRPFLPTKLASSPLPVTLTTHAEVRPDMKAYVQNLLQDPSNILLSIPEQQSGDTSKTTKFKQVLSSSNVDLVALRQLSWSGIPKEFRLMAWQLLLGYLPCNSARRVATLARKRKEYADSVAASYARGTSGLDQGLWHQIHIDIPRTNPGIPLYHYETTQMCLERILYQWAIRHPASGYVQGINDLVTPIFEVFLSAYISDEDPEEYDIRQLDQEVLDVIEADSFWCLSKLLDGIQDNYTFAQPGIQRQISTLKELVCRIDVRLASHLQQEGIEFIQFAFRWMNCLLMRELPLKSTIRMWDTYLAEGSSEGFSEFHVYVCAAFLVKWSDQLQKLDFQGVMIFLQQLPTQGWVEKDVELLLSEAYMWKTLFHNAPSHLK